METLTIIVICICLALIIGFLTMLFVWWWTSINAPNDYKIKENYKHKYWEN